MDENDENVDTRISLTETVEQLRQEAKDASSGQEVLASVTRDGGLAIRPAGWKHVPSPNPGFERVADIVTLHDLSHITAISEQDKKKKIEDLDICTWNCDGLVYFNEQKLNTPEEQAGMFNDISILMDNHDVILLQDIKIHNDNFDDRVAELQTFVAAYNDSASERQFYAYLFPRAHRELSQRPQDIGSGGHIILVRTVVALPEEHTIVDTCVAGRFAGIIIATEPQQTVVVSVYAPSTIYYKHETRSTFTQDQYRVFGDSNNILQVFYNFGRDPQQDSTFNNRTKIQLRIEYFHDLISILTPYENDNIILGGDFNSWKYYFDSEDIQDDQENGLGKKMYKILYEAGFKSAQQDLSPIPTQQSGNTLDNFLVRTSVDSYSISLNGIYNSGFRRCYDGSQVSEDEFELNPTFLNVHAPDHIPMSLSVSNNESDEIPEVGDMNISSSTEEKVQEEVKDEEGERRRSSAHDSRGPFTTSGEEGKRGSQPGPNEFRLMEKEKDIPIHKAEEEKQQEQQEQQG